MQGTVAQNGNRRRVKLKREARSLKAKALCSLRRAVTAFNSCDDDGRTTCVLLHMQHTAHLLLTAVLHQNGETVSQPNNTTSIKIELSSTQRRESR